MPRIAIRPGHEPHSPGSRPAARSTDPFAPTSRSPHRPSHDAAELQRQVRARVTFQLHPPVRLKLLSQRRELRLQAVPFFEPSPQRARRHPNYSGPRLHVIELESVPEILEPLLPVRALHPTRVAALTIEVVNTLRHDASSRTPANQRHVSHSPFPLHVQTRVCHVARSL